MGEYSGSEQRMTRKQGEFTAIENMKKRVLGRILTSLILAANIYILFRHPRARLMVIKSNKKGLWIFP